ncbi:DUF3450 family protein [Thalassolituus marinus]|uniref:DUF3450 family protein n=1 Tax=Thalassolituus marinus TaxID=671053 RepID=A0ABS7ZPQ7_9GAMM|nr:DUF3450 family protein [Thalassolituus marinus]MCA6063672.1 DUF3450 family protein [Thalassolituus marinus]
MKTPLRPITLLLALACPPALASDKADQLDQLTRQWLDTERQATHLQNDWLQQKPALEQRLTLLKSEQAQLQALLSENHDSRDEVEQKRNELLQQQAQLESEQSGVADVLQALSRRLDALQPMLPPPLQTGWNKSEGAEDDALRLQLARLNRLKEFNERVTLHSMRLPHESGNEVLVQQLYLGLAQAWFVSADGEYRGYGRAEQGQWQWHFSKEINAADIQHAIAIAEKQKPAADIALPFTLNTTQTLAEAAQ